MPVVQVMPAGDSAILGVGSPLRGSTVMLRVTMAPTRRSVGEPGEFSTGARTAGRHQDRGRERQLPQVNGDRAFHPGHERTTGRPSGGVGSIVGASESHRSQSTRAGLNTGPSMHDRRLSYPLPSLRATGTTHVKQRPISACHPLLDRHLRGDLSLPTEAGDPLERLRRCGGIHHLRTALVGHLRQHVHHRATVAQAAVRGDDLDRLR